MASEHRFCLHQFAVCSVLSGHGTMVLKSATMPPKVFDQMYDHILTDKGMEIFDNDWKEVQNDICSVFKGWMPLLH